MSSYRGHFSDLSPSDQADIASFSEADPPECAMCSRIHNIDHDASETAGLWLCGECVEETVQGACHE